MFKIDSPRLHLRDILPRDVRTLAAQFAEPSAAPCILERQRQPDYVLRTIRSAIDPPRLSHRSGFRLAMVVKATGELAGTCTLAFAEPGTRGATLGWHVGEAHSGKGYATEAGRALLALAFAVNGVRAVNLDCFAHNERVQRVLSKLGLQLHTTTRWGRWWLRVRYSEERPIVRYRIDRGSWSCSAPSLKDTFDHCA